MKVSERVPGIGETIRKGGTTPGHARTRGVGTGHPGPARSPRCCPLGIEYSQRDVVSSHRRTPATSPRRSAHQIGARRVPTGGEVPTLESFSRGGVRAASGPAAVYPAGRGILPAGNTREECLFLLYGIGRNGKGTFIKTLTEMLGDYAGTADFSTFVQRTGDGGPRDDIANMKGRHMVSAQESREGASLAESIIKWLTGGDLVRARRIYENSFEFQPTHKIWLASNHKPAVRGTDAAIWSRIKLIPFAVSFEGREDRGLKDALREELPGILAWSVQGCVLWQKDGLQFPETVTKATEEYRAENDQVGR